MASCLMAVDPAAREKELVYLRSLLPETLLPFANLEVAGIENIKLDDAEGDPFLALRVFPGQKKHNGGIRAEVSVDYPFKPGDTVGYSWKFRVPPDFKSDAPQNRWCIIGQWHDQPDQSLGEVWEGFPSRSPTILIGLGELDGKLGIGINYGLKQAETFGPVFIEAGKWHTIKTVVHWSQKEDGKATFYFDDMTKPIAVIEGPNLHNNYQHFLKLGLYRHPGILTDNSIHIDGVEIGHQ